MSIIDTGMRGTTRLVQIDSIETITQFFDKPLGFEMQAGDADSILYVLDRHEDVLFDLGSDGVVRTNRLPEALR